MNSSTAELSFDNILYLLELYSYLHALYNLLYKSTSLFINTLLLCIVYFIVNSPFLNVKVAYSILLPHNPCILFLYNILHTCFFIDTPLDLIYSLLI